MTQIPKSGEPNPKRLPWLTYCRLTLSLSSVPLTVFSLFSFPLNFFNLLMSQPNLFCWYFNLAQPFSQGPPDYHVSQHVLLANMPNVNYCCVKYVFISKDHIDRTFYQ